MMDPRSLANIKLQSLPKPDLDELAAQLGRGGKGTVGNVVTRLLDPTQPLIDTGAVDAFIKRKYADKIRRRRERVISDDDLLAELRKVEEIDWGVEQGQLDGKIQREYVRKFARYDDLVQGVAGKLHGDITGYVVASWYNHWSTVLIEDHISEHPNVVPTIKNVAGVDLFFKDTPFDLKMTRLPKNWIPRAQEAVENPAELAKWLYENQGAATIRGEQPLLRRAHRPLRRGGELAVEARDGHRLPADRRLPRVGERGRLGCLAVLLR